MSKIIKINKCEGFCKHRKNNQRNQHRLGSLTCGCWNLFTDNYRDWFKVIYDRHCKYQTEQQYVKSKK
jgi:hypothetical protein